MTLNISLMQHYLMYVALEFGALSTQYMWNCKFIHYFNHVENVFTGLCIPVIQVLTGPLQHVLFNQSVLDFVPSMASLSCCMT